LSVRHRGLASTLGSPITLIRFAKFAFGRTEANDPFALDPALSAIAGQNASKLFFVTACRTESENCWVPA
jgi:hypothetical protein